MVFASVSFLGYPTLNRSPSNTLISVCSTSGRNLGFPVVCHSHPPGRRLRREASAQTFYHASRLRRRRGFAFQASAHNASGAGAQPCPSLSGHAGQTSTATLASAKGRCPSRTILVRSAPVRTTSVSPERGGGSSGSSIDEDPNLPCSGAITSLTKSTTVAAAVRGAGSAFTEPSPSLPLALYEDLEDAVPYYNGSNGSAASVSSIDVSVQSSDSPAEPDTAAPAAAAAVVAPNPDEVCVVGVGPDGESTTLCMPVSTIPTVADVMQTAPDAIAIVAAANTASAAASVHGGGAAAVTAANPAIIRPMPTVVDAAISVTLRPTGFGFPDSNGNTRLASGPDLASDIAFANASTDPDGSGAIPRIGGSASSMGPAGGSIDMADTPEGLTDVESSSVAPVADWLKDQDDITTLTYAVLTGGLVAAAVFIFDVSIQTIHDLPDIFSTGLGIGGGRKTGLEIFGTAVPFRCVMPVAAGFAVAWLQKVGFSPALKVLTRAMEGVTDDSAKATLPKSYWQVARKAIASAVTLGSGASLGPEAPSVELGANTAAVIAPKNLSKRRQRMLIAAGAAAGVSAAFDAPVSGALFAVEFVLKSSRLGLDRLSTSTVFVSTSVAAGVIGFLRTQGQALGIAGAGTHLVGRIPYFSIQPNLLVDVLQFSALGLGCSVVAVALYEGVRVSEIALRPLPRWLSAPTAGALCGIIAYRFPQVQYGYVNLEEIFRDSTGMSAGDLTALLTAKIVATAVCVGGGLVGGLFAPSLFLGALVGDVMGHFVAGPWGLPDPTSLVVVGAAAVLGAACRAPLTAIALMVEITRDTGLLVPLLSAIGVASLFTDYLEGIFSKRLEQALVELYLREKAFFWAASLVAPPGSATGDGVKTVEDVLGTRANLYVRHTLPLAQAKAAMAAKAASAAVVVDDNFSPLGVVYLEDVEAELIRQRLLNEPDANFNRQ
ncbi:hypothetical protein VaNZ11_002859 [Volvox africanus]|uniref:Chloride channel protein n=1 Tax=Volvox africanus TaxID=51714 RepID=A0ABQ5RT67_9CHLO|nr:hypothetical protein VaNZ11_002859 [Volvox africanus]